jgi:hypothetical protein
MAGQNTFTTLRHVLSQEKPSVPCATELKYNSLNKGWPDLKGLITLWDDFNLNNLNESYGHVLDLAVPEQQLMGPRPDQAFAGVVIDHPDDINHLISWNDALMQPTLQFAKSHLRLHPGVILRHKHSAVGKPGVTRLPNGAKRLTVDHVIGLDDFPGPNLVVGLGRPSSKWSGRQVANQLHNSSMEQLWPLRQLANICDTAQTRYGYIQTDEELVVCRFSKNPERAKNQQWTVAMMPIPWSRHGVDVLTTDLALWWLCMLAMSAHHHRTIVRVEELVKINHWDVVYLGEERGWGRRHRYSGYETPSPGNAEVLEAGAGPHANDWHNVNPADGGLANLVALNNFDDAAWANLDGFQNPEFTPIQ